MGIIFATQGRLAQSGDIVTMKSDKIKLAIQLRSEGMSARSIAERLSCSKSSVTRWIQDMPLDDLIIQKIKNSNDKKIPPFGRHTFFAARKGIFSSLGKFYMAVSLPSTVL